jgi:DNA-binding Lrp family transcriptional regulator
MRSKSPLVKLDSIDAAILEALQADGRLSNLELAQRVHLSPSACLRRVKQLEESGVIAGYVALLNPKAVGAHGTSFTIVNLETLGGNALDRFEQAVRDEPRILDCYYVAGSNDYLIRFAYRDAEPGTLSHRGADAAAGRGAVELDAGTADGEEDDGTAAGRCDRRLKLIPASAAGCESPASRTRWRRASSPC